MKNLFAGIIAIPLLSTSAFATDGPLSPGKPAGVKQAQYIDNTVLIVIGVGAIAAGIAIAASSGGHGNNNSGGTTTSTTGTSP